MNRVSPHILHIVADKPLPRPRVQKSMPSEKVKGLMDEWQRALLGQRQDKTLRVADELVDMIKASPYKDDCTLKQVMTLEFYQMNDL